MFKLIGIVALVFSCSSVHAAGDLMAYFNDSQQQYGQNLVTEFDIDADTIERFMNHTSSQGDRNASLMENALSARTEDWISNRIAVNSEKNPYRIVVTLSATENSDGDAASTWLAGWRDANDIDKIMPFPGLIKSDAKAGENFTITATAPPVSFKSTAEYAAVLNLVNLKNMSIKTMHVQVWSGIADASLMEIFFSMQTLIIGLVMIVLWNFFKGRY